jgi:hypothetical protein
MWARRTARRMFWTRNPLRRTPDRIQAWLTLGLALTMLLAAPEIGWWAARMAYQSGMGATAWEWQHRFPVDAVLLGDGSGWPVDGAPPTLTPARWKNPDGAMQTGMIFTGEKQRSGTTVRIWVDDSGAVVPRPGLRNAPADATLIGLLAVSGVAAGLYGLRGIVVWRLNRRRLRAWQDDWLLVEPHWSHR